MKRSYFFIIFLSLFLPAFAKDGDDFEYEGINYTIISETNRTCRTKRGAYFSPYYAGNPNVTGVLNIPEKVKNNDNAEYTVIEIGFTSFYECSEITNLTLPSTIQTIEQYAFNNCKGITGDLKIPDSVTSIGFGAFWECSGFNGTLTLPENLKEIEEFAFIRCSGLTGDLKIPDSVTSIGCDAFAECSGFNGTLTLPENLKEIEEGTFEGCSGFTGDLKIPDSVTSIGFSAFAECSGFNGTLTLPSKLQTIKYHTFYRCSGLTGNLIIPESVTSIGIYAFSGCSGFDGTLTIPSNLQTIENGTFYRCSGLTGNLIIPESVTSIGMDAFSYCSRLTGDLIIPESVTSIGSNAFTGCSGFNSVYSYSINPPECAISAFNSLYTKPLYVPQESILSYQTASGWKNFTKIYPIPIEATGISLNKSSLELQVDQVETLTATLTPENANTEVKWSVNEEGESIVSVTQEGKVTALAIGETVITATAGELSASCKVKVTPMEIESVYLTMYETIREPGIGERIVYIANVSPSEKYTGPLTYEWSTNEGFMLEDLSDDFPLPSIIPCSKVAVATQLGEAQIYLTVKNSVSEKSTSASQLILPDEILSVKIEGLETMFIGEKQTLKAKVTPETGTEPNTILWSTESHNISLNTSTGEVIALSEGTAVVKVEATNERSLENLSETDEFTILITRKPDPSIQLTLLDGDKDNFYIGQQLTYKVDAKYTSVKLEIPEGSEKIKSFLEPTASDLDIITPEMTITALSAGDVKIRIVSTINPELYQEITLNILAPSIIVKANHQYPCTHAEKTMKIGEKINLMASITPQDVEYGNMTWISSVPGVVSVNSQTGEAEAISAGEASISVNFVDFPEIVEIFDLQVKDMIMGDANDSGNVNAADVITVRNEIMAHSSNQSSQNESFCFINSDVDPNKIIDVVDQAAITNLALGKPAFATTLSTRAMFASVNDNLIIDDYTSQSEVIIGFDLENADNYVILQADIILPEGMAFIDACKGNKASDHILVFNEGENGLVRVMVYSLSNKPFSSLYGNLFSIVADASSASGDITVDDIIAADREIQRHELTSMGGKLDYTTKSDDVSLNSIPGIYGDTGKIVITGAIDKECRVFTLDGQLIAREIPMSSYHSIYLRQGIYLVVLEEKNMKVIVR